MSVLAIRVIVKYLSLLTHIPNWHSNFIRVVKCSVMSKLSNFFLEFHNILTILSQFSKWFYEVVSLQRHKLQFSQCFLLLILIFPFHAFFVCPSLCFHSPNVEKKTLSDALTFTKKFGMCVCVVSKTCVEHTMYLNVEKCESLIRLWKLANKSD